MRADTILAPLRFLEAQVVLDGLNNLVRARRDIDAHRCLGFLECFELAVEQIWLHEMAGARSEALSNNFMIPLEVNENDPFIDPQKLTVALLQRGAGENGRIALLKASADQVTKNVQPRFSISIIERDGAPHLLNIGTRVEIVSFVKLPTEFLGKQSSDRRLARAADAHQNYDYTLFSHYRIDSIANIVYAHERLNSRASISGEKRSRRIEKERLRQRKIGKLTRAGDAAIGVIPRSLNFKSYCLMPD